MSALHMLAEAYGGQKRATEPLKLEGQIAGKRLMAAGKQTMVQTGLLTTEPLTRLYSLSFLIHF